MFKFIWIFLLQVQLLEFISGVMNAQGSSGSVLCTSTQINRQEQEHMKVKMIFVSCNVQYLLKR